MLRAQDITGIWRGHFGSSTIMARSGGNDSAHSAWGFDERYKFEVQIAQRGKQFGGVTYSYLSSIFYGKATAAGTINPKTRKVLLQEGQLLELRNDFGGACIMTCFLQYTKSGNEEFLEGTYVSMSLKDSSNCGRGVVFLRKEPVSFFYTEPFVAAREKELADSAKIKRQLAMRKPATNPAPSNSAPLARNSAPARTTLPGKRPPAADSQSRARMKPAPEETPLRTAPMATVTVPKEMLHSM
ncbi:MAG TPA: hypothetical protein VNU72_04480, partial [Puia sp.]|nr:hypothetical protein [Puia sp.]